MNVKVLTLIMVASGYAKSKNPDELKNVSKAKEVSYNSTKSRNSTFAIFLQIFREINFFTEIDFTKYFQLQSKLVHITEFLFCRCWIQLIKKYSKVMRSKS